jgi:hypothetical protein
MIAGSHNGDTMSDHRPPRIEINLADLPADPAERHEVLVDIFGRYIMWARDKSVSVNGVLIESEQSRKALGGIRRRKYDQLAALAADQQATACSIAEATVDRFIQLLLVILTGIGADQRLGEDHAFIFKLDVEIIDAMTLAIVERETINRGGKKVFAEYWGRWLNRFSSAK